MTPVYIFFFWSATGRHSSGHHLMDLIVRTLFSRANRWPASKQTLWTAKNYKEFSRNSLVELNAAQFGTISDVSEGGFSPVINSSSILLWHFMTVCPKDLHSTFIQNFVTFLPDYTALCVRKGRLLVSTVRTPNPASDAEDSSAEV